MKKSILLLAIIGIFIPAVNAQEKQAWSTSFKGSINWTRITPLGFLLVNSSAGLHGVDPESGEITWTHAELAGASEGSFAMLEGTPFATINGPQGGLFMFEPIEGSIVFSSKEAGFKTVDNQFFLYKPGTILILGLKEDDKPGLSMIDMSTGKALWSKPSEFGMVTASYDLSEKHCLISTLFFIFKMDVKTGDEVWKKSMDPKFEKMAGLMAMLDKGNAGGLIKKEDLVGKILVPEQNPSACYVAVQAKNEKTVNGETTVSYSSNYNAFDLETGEYIWPAVVQFPDMLGTTIAAERGFVTCPMSSGNSRINVLDYKTGESVLGKKGRGITVKGSVLGYSLIDQGILVNTRVLSGSSTKNYIYLLDTETLEPKFKKPADLKGDVSKVIDTGGKLVIITSEETNIYDPGTGELLLKDAVEGGANLTAEQGDRIYAFNTDDDLLYSIDRSNGSVQALSSTELKFDGKEKPQYIELREKGVVVSAEQNIVMYDYDGNMVFQKYLPAPRLPGITRALMAAYAVRAAYVGAVSGYASAAFGAASANIEVEKGDANAAVAKGMTQGMSQAYGELSKAGFAYADKAFKAMNTRFKATTESNTSMLMMVDKGDKVYGLQELNKDTGAEESFIDMGKDKEPVYEVDAVANRIFYRRSGTSLVCYSF